MKRAFRLNIICFSALLFLTLVSCTDIFPLGEDSPAEIKDYSDDYTNAVVYRVTASFLNIEAMGHYPQQTADQPDSQSGRSSVTLRVKNQSYYGLDKVPISEQTYPETVRSYLEPSDKVRWDGPEMEAFLSKIQGEDVMAYVNNAAWWSSKTLGYDVPLSVQISNGESDTVGAAEALASGKGTCSEYTNLFIAALRAKGIPARFVSGLWYDGTTASGIGSYHAWAEFYLQGYGWLPVDPQAGHLGVPDTYIKLYVGMDFVDIGIPLADIGAEVSLEPDG